MLLVHRICTQHPAAKAHEHPADAGLSRRQRKAAGIVQIARPIGTERAGWPHCARQQHRPRGRQHQRQEECRLLQRVGAVRDDDGIGRLVTAQPCPQPTCQLQPVRPAHLLAGNREDLLGGQSPLWYQSRQPRHGIQNLPDGQRPRLVAGRVARRRGYASNGAARANDQERRGRGCGGGGHGRETGVNRVNGRYRPPGKCSRWGVHSFSTPGIAGAARMAG